MPTRPHVVYGLCDPRDKKLSIRYVGCTVQKLCNRLRSHLHEAIHDDHVDTQKADWIRYLLLSDTDPLCVMLETVPLDGNWQKREQHWIKHFAGPDLLNLTAGGVGAVGLDASIRSSINAQNTGKKQSEETKQKRAATWQAKDSYINADEFTLYKREQMRRFRTNKAAGIKPDMEAIRAQAAIKISSLIWITDGISTARITPDDDIPPGWRRGRLPRK